MEEEEAPATAMPPPPSSSSSTAAQESRMRTHREYHAQERYPMEGQWRARGVAPLPPPPSASHSSFVEGTRQGRSPRLPSSALVQQDAHGVRMSVLLRHKVERRH
jgi:hypothetical protein